MKESPLNLSTPRIKKHINSTIKDNLYIEDCKNEQPKIYSRGLVAIFLSYVSCLDYAAISKFITDGGKDNGIDGCFYDKTKNKLYLIQSKWSENGTKTIGSGDIHKFIKGTYDLLDEKWEKFNARFHDIKSDLKSWIEFDPEIVLVIIYNSGNELSEDCKSILDEFENDNCKCEGQQLVSYTTFCLNDILKAIRASKNGNKVDIEFDIKEWGEMYSPYYAVYGHILCADLAESYILHGDVLFTENIRFNIQKSEINSKIQEAITDVPEKFWYLNNGITAICDEIRRRSKSLKPSRESALWSINNLKIVNGAQTTCAIAETFKLVPEKVKNAYVQIKIISLSKAPIDIAKEITTATNTQNKVEPRDFLSLETLQEDLADEFKKIGIHYCYRRGEKKYGLSKSVDIQNLALSMATCSPNMADVVMAKRNVGSLTDPNGHYKKIFVQPLDVEKLWETYCIWLKAQEVVNSIQASKAERDEQIVVHGNRFIENILVQRHPTDITPKKAEAIFRAIKKIINQQFKDCYLAVFFKNIKKCEMLKEHLASMGL